MAALLEYEKGAKPSTLSGYRGMLADPGLPYRRRRGETPGRIMEAFDSRPAVAITTREVANYLRGLERGGASARTVNRRRQVISAIYGYAMREDATASNATRPRARPSAASRRRRCSTSTSPRRSRRSRGLPSTVNIATSRS